jgi:hypothetical protein
MGLLPLSHLRPKLKLYDSVCRTDDPRHAGVIISMFKWKRYDEWIANVQWIESRWVEYVPMDMLVHAGED